MKLLDHCPTEFFQNSSERSSDRNHQFGEYMEMIKSFFRGIKGKILLSVFIPVIAFIGITGVNLSGLMKVNSKIAIAVTDIIPSLQNLEEVIKHTHSMGQFAWTAIASDKPETKKANLEKLKSNYAKFKEHLILFEKGLSHKEEIEAYNKVKPILGDFYSLTDQAISHLEKATPEGDKEAASILSGKWSEHMTAIDELIEKDKALYHNLSADLEVSSQELYRQILNLTILVTSLGIFGLIGLLMWQATRLSREINKFVIDLEGSGKIVAGSITQLTGAGSNLSQASAATAASLEETVASLEEMTAMVQMNSDNAKQAASLSQASRDAAEQGEKEIQNLIQSMNEIAHSSKKIEEIINVIDDIAFQTNLLALNASVEAARAGEQGKGFAVVAEAVRALSQRSASAAKDITELIKESANKIDRGTDIADKSGVVLNNIVTSVKKVADLNNEIATASTEQTAGIQQISRAMNQLDQTAQNNAASAEEIASTAQEIQTQSSHMSTLVEHLSTMVDGAKDSQHIESFSRHHSTENAHPTPSAKKSDSEKGKVLKFKKSDSKPKNETKAKPVAKKEMPKFESRPVKKAANDSHSNEPKSSDIIPFDEDDSRSKIGSTDSF